MPKLETMLKDIFEQLEISTAVYEKVAPPAPSKLETSHNDSTDSSEGFGAVLALGGLPVGSFVAGALMLIGAFGATAAISNAYMALLFIFGGIGLGVTSFLAYREAHAG
ncbi:MAG TPA: hypothetical protein VGG37_05340 [Opitutaceae bacterium]|jgi:hypothetical protein